MASRPSQAQLEGLVEFLEQNPGIGRGLLRTSQGKLETKRKWADLAVTLNSLGGANKTGPGWAKYWSEKKCGLKRQCAELSASMRRTGGGTADNLPTLSALENRLVAVLGGQQFATGDSRWTRPTESPVVIEASPIIPGLVEIHSLNSNLQISPPIPGTPHNDAIPASPTILAPPSPLHNTIPTRPRRRRRSLIPRSSEPTMQQFENIEARRVEAELTTAQAFTHLTEHIGTIASALTSIGTIASALTSIATAISDVARKLPNP